MKILDALKGVDIVDINYFKSYLNSSKNATLKPNMIEKIGCILLFFIKQIVKDFLAVLINNNIKNKNLFLPAVNQHVKFSS